MLFSSTIFIFLYLPSVIAVYFLLGQNRTIKNIILLFSSLFFYAWGEPYFVIMMIVSIGVNYIFGLLVSKYDQKKIQAKLILATMCIYNLGILFIFKYLGFAITNINEIFGLSGSIPSVLLPIGISFYTFQAMSYVIDIYRHKAKAQRNPLYVGLYISLFPQLIAGPIVRYETISEQLIYRRETFYDFSRGTCRFIRGLAKKVLLANTFAIIADKAFIVDYEALSVSFAWVGALSYTFQIYYDFSGYSDMAIGLGKMFGFTFEENFNYPYYAKSITDFWRRWHISLSTWFRDYVYIPLGGKYSSKKRHILNMFTVWLLTGLWHGASWNFVIWGLFYFVLLIVEKFLIMPERFNRWYSNGAYRIFTILAVIFAWVLFRAEGMANAFDYSLSMLGLRENPVYDSTTFIIIKENIFYYVMAILLSFPLTSKLVGILNKENKLVKILYNILLPLVYLIIFIVSISYLVIGSYNPFIYFNF